MEESNKRRDRHDIIAEILKTAKEARIKTHIMYKAKLSYAQVNEYLPLLIKKGFLEPFTVQKRKIRRKLYRTTEKGLQLLENFDFIADLWT